MKIALFDPYFLKFTDGMVKWWESQGYEVKVDRYYDPEKVLWADVVWFDTVDNNIKSATNPSEAILADSANFQPWDMHNMDLTGKKIICRAIDIEVWYGSQHGVLWDVVTDLVFIAPHIKKQFGDIPPHIKVHDIPCAVDFDKYNFRDHSAGGYKIGIVSEKWTSKGTDLALQVALELKLLNVPATFHWLGKWSDYEWEKAYFLDFIDRHELNFEFTEWIEEANAVDTFLEDKDFLLHCSHKEAFSYATAEAMAKGIKPILHHFYGAEYLWPDITWSSVNEAVDMILEEEYNSDAYRDYLLERGYSLPQMMAKFEEVING